jgi:hypothetical protein
MDKKDKSVELLMAIKAKITKMLAMNRKSKKLIALGVRIAKKEITKNKRKVKKLEDKIKLAPEKEKEIRAKIDKIKEKIVLYEKINVSFSVLDTELNKETGFLTNEAGSLKDLNTINKATAAEKACVANEKEILATLLELVQALRQKPKKTPQKQTAK